MAKLINIGFGNVVNSRKIVAVVSPDAAPVKRMIQSIKGTRSLIDATQGRKTKAVIVTSDDYLVLSALQPETIARRLRKLIIMKKRKRNMSKGVLTVVSGFSGAGKGTVMKRLLEKYENYALSISVTTRKPREGERDGIEYFFRTREEVEAMIQEDQLLEHAEYVGNYYGTPRFYVEDMLSQGKNVILEIEIQGAMKIKEKIPEAVLVFVTPPTIEELRSRLIGRGTETADVIASRLRRAAEESEGMNNYDYILINDQVEDCVDQLHQIILSERCRAQRNEELINTIQEEARIFMKGDK